MSDLTFISTEGIKDPAVQLALDQLQNNIQQVLLGAVDTFSMTVLYAQPARLWDGLFALADGTTWNPGSGKGLYRFDGTNWNFLG